MRWPWSGGEPLPEPESTDALVEELDVQLTRAQELVSVLRERVKVAEYVQRIESQER